MGIEFLTPIGFFQHVETDLRIVWQRLSTVPGSKCRFLQDDEAAGDRYAGLRFRASHSNMGKFWEFPRYA
jgi:hypothetical protein